MSGTITLGRFPVIRRLSRPFAVQISKFPVTPNQITTLSLLSGVAAAVCFTQDDYEIRLAGSILFIICYLLDNCDGEIARLKNLNTDFGGFFDTFTDWTVHAAFFIGLGYGVYQSSDNTIWLWLGIFAAGGATINYLIGVFRDAGYLQSPSNQHQVTTQTGKYDFFILIFRELARADFCFIVLTLTLLSVEWILLPVAALGAQVYWMLQFMDNANKFHV